MKKSKNTFAILMAVAFTIATAATVKAQYGSYYQRQVQQQVMAGGNRVCVYVPTTHTSQYGVGIGGGVNYGGVSGWGGQGNVNAGYQNQQSYTVNQAQCGRNIMPQQGQQFYINNRGWLGNSGYRTPVMVWDNRLNQWVQR